MCTTAGCTAATALDTAWEYASSRLFAEGALASVIEVESMMRGRNVIIAVTQSGAWPAALADWNCTHERSFAFHRTPAVSEKAPPASGSKDELIENERFVLWPLGRMQETCYRLGNLSDP